MVGKFSLEFMYGYGILKKFVEETGVVGETQDEEVELRLCLLSISATPDTAVTAAVSVALKNLPPGPLSLLTA
jgi:hypothetical protein